MKYISFSSGRLRLVKVSTVIVLCLGFMTVYQYAVYSGVIENQNEEDNEIEMLSEVKRDKLADVNQILEHSKIVNNFYERRKTWVTSNLGSMLFKNQPQKGNRDNKEFVVLIWKYYDWLKHRHINRFNKFGFDPLDDCSVQNCKFIGGESEIKNVDAVVVHIQHGLKPKIDKRNLNQIWIFLSDESPRNAFSLSKIMPDLTSWANIFNWSMTYRSDAEVPVPYGRTVAFAAPIMPNVLPDTIAKYVPYWKDKKRDVLVTVLMSNCHVSERMEYLDELKTHIDVDIHGKCSNEHKNSCPGHFRADCKVINEYLFYLVLENSKCRQYLTEKSFNNAYLKGAIPVIMGPPKQDCKELLPPHSFLHVNDYASPKELAAKLLLIAESNKTLLEYHQWRNNFEVRNEHGYFGWKSYHFCRICEALNYNSPSTNIYDADSLRKYLDPGLLCT